jgi:hypothetical protein
MSNSIASMLSVTITRVSLVVLAIMAASTVARAQTISGTCTPSADKFIASKDGRPTTSTNYTNLSGASIGFTQGGASSSCVLVSFTGNPGIDPSTTMIVRATLDGHTMAIPDELFFGTNMSGVPFFDTRSANFIFPNVAPGQHRIRMQFKSSNGGLVQFTQTTLIVRYAR